MQTVIDLLLKQGFVRDGRVLWRVTCSSGSALALGGKQRFALPNTDIRATVGKRLTHFYRLTDAAVLGSRQTVTIAHLPTRELANVATALQQIPQPEAQV